MKVYTTLRVQRSTAELLKNSKMKGESDDAAILRLLDVAGMIKGFKMLIEKGGVQVEK